MRHASLREQFACHYWPSLNIPHGNIECTRECPEYMGCNSKAWQGWLAANMNWEHQWNVIDNIKNGSSNPSIVLPWVLSLCPESHISSFGFWRMVPATHTYLYIKIKIISVKPYIPSYQACFLCCFIYAHLPNGKAERGKTSKELKSVANGPAQCFLLWTTFGGRGNRTMGKSWNFTPSHSPKRRPNVSLWKIKKERNWDWREIWTNSEKILEASPKLMDGWIIVYTTLSD